MLVDVAALAPDLRIVLAGDGPCRDALEELVRERGLDNVAFTGYVAPDELARLYHASDVLFAQVRPSHAPCGDGGALEALRVHGGRPADRLRGRGCRGRARRGDRRRPDDGAGRRRARSSTQFAPSLSRRRSRGVCAAAIVSELPIRGDEMRRFVRLVSELAAAR